MLQTEALCLDSMPYRQRLLFLLSSSDKHSGISLRSIYLYGTIVPISIRIYGSDMRDFDLAGEVGRGLLILFLLKSSDDQEGKRSRCAHSCAAGREVYNGNILPHCKLRRRTPPHNGCARCAALPPLLCDTLPQSSIASLPYAPIQGHCKEGL